jgi:hypothetical protein
LEGGMKMMWQRLMREAEVPRKDGNHA